ncbi:MAG: hypothetical protein GWP08_20035, partial [Nitrospiraceae bacterium]|nr:hypothetical protein [Nitrospiraceae bacterium]
MRSVMNNRGVILRGAVVLVLLVSLPMALTTLKTTPVVQSQLAAVLDAVEAPPDDLLSLREAAHARLRKGEIPEGALDLLDSLRALPDDPALLEDAHGTLQLLAFTMVGLMRDEALASFEAQLDPEQWPIDALVLAYFYLEVEDYARFRKMEMIAAPEIWKQLDAVQASSSELVRAGGLLLAASPYMWTRIGPAELERMLGATNAFAAVLPDSRLLREIVREHVRACLGPGFHPLPDIQALFGALMGGAEVDKAEAAVEQALSDEVPLYYGTQGVQAMVGELPWHPAIQKILADDPVVALALDAAELAGTMLSQPGMDEETVRQACLELVLEQAETHADASVRDWCLRSTVIFEGTPHERATDAEVTLQRETCETVTTALTGALPPPEERVPVDGARAALNLLAAAAQRDDVTG